MHDAARRFDGAPGKTPALIGQGISAIQVDGLLVAELMTISPEFPFYIALSSTLSVITLFSISPDFSVHGGRIEGKHHQLRERAIGQSFIERLPHPALPGPGARQDWQGGSFANIHCTPSGSIRPHNNIHPHTFHPPLSLPPPNSSGRDSDRGPRRHPGPLDGGAYDLPGALVKVIELAVSRCQIECNLPTYGTHTMQLCDPSTPYVTPLAPTPGNGFKVSLGEGTENALGSLEQLFWKAPSTRRLPPCSRRPPRLDRARPG